MKDDAFKFALCGDRAFILQFGERINLEINCRVRSMFLSLCKNPFAGFIEAVPCYRSLLIYYDPLVAGLDQIKTHLLRLEDEQERIASEAKKRVEIPVVYGGEYGPDLDFVAGYHGIRAEEVVRLHTAAVYVCCMYGFDPGFALLIGLPPELETPRMDSPRLKVPAGSVGIGAAQTGVYPFERAGGWRIIGRTPSVLFNLNRDPPVLVNIGDEVVFVAVAPEDYSRLAGAVS